MRAPEDRGESASRFRRRCRLVPYLRQLNEKRGSASTRPLGIGTYRSRCASGSTTHLTWCGSRASAFRRPCRRFGKRESSFRQARAIHQPTEVPCSRGVNGNSIANRRTQDQRSDKGTRGPARRRGRAADRHQASRRGIEHGPSCRARSRRGCGSGQPAGLSHHGLRQVQVRSRSAGQGVTP